MQPVLYLFPDTNVFLQCKPLNQTSWEAFGQWERIEVVVTRPVQTEIDALKGNGNGRRAAKARAASSLLRRLLDIDPPVIVLSSSPLVQLTVRRALPTDASAANVLNYDAKDDQLVGIALAFQKAHPESVTRLLTDDTGVMFSAQEVGIEYIDIPPEWPLPPEVDESAKREKALREQLAIYEKSEPQFTIDISATLGGTNPTAPEDALPAASNSKKAVRAGGIFTPFRATLTKYSPLTEGEIDARWWQGLSSASPRPPNSAPLNRRNALLNTVRFRRFCLGDSRRFLHLHPLKGLIPTRLPIEDGQRGVRSCLRPSTTH